MSAPYPAAFFSEPCVMANDEDDNQDLERLIEEGQALVRSLAVSISRNIPMRVDLDDLIADGQVGLVQAARDFDPQRDVKFTTFAYYRIRGAIYDGVSKMSWTSRARSNRLRWDRMAEETLREVHENHPLGETPTLEEEIRWFREAAEKLAVVVLVNQAEDGSRPEEQWEDVGEPAPPTLLADRELREKLRGLVDKLPLAERRLIRTIYFEGTTLKEASVRLSISKSWASRLHAKALEKLAGDLRRMGAD